MAVPSVARRAIVLPDRACSSRARFAHLRRRGIRAELPQPADWIADRRCPDGKVDRPPAFDKTALIHRFAVHLTAGLMGRGPWNVTAELPT
ncbi:hypothetical protein ACIBSV_22730 [Embleya sp. NPDC050154]|uniref:hypothetical protein n=1 Tax=Embleya sp. NPDC050154 TaxID=3363988 RepID=UPI003798B0D0